MTPSIVGDLLRRNGSATMRVPIAGKLRAGVKMLTGDAIKAYPFAEELFWQGVREGYGFDFIEKVIVDKAGKTKANLPEYLMRPANAPFFRIVPEDFADPASARAILETFGEDRGDKWGRQIYSLPIVLASDEILDNIPHSFTQWAKSGRARWSEYREDGKRFCMEMMEPKNDPRAKRGAKRVFGGRNHQLRGACNPDECPEFGAGLCKLDGSIRFYVPGYPGIGLIEVETGSVYALTGLMATLEQAQQGMGRIAGTFGGQPIFRLLKREKEISRIDWEKKQPTRSKQQIIELDCLISMVDVARQLEMGGPLRLAAPPSCAALEYRPGPEAKAPETASGLEVVAKEPSNLEILQSRMKAATTAMSDQGRADLRKLALRRFGTGFWSNEQALRQLCDLVEAALMSNDWGFLQQESAA
ncbi:MAG: hypothetical protein HQL56_05640 [Magnetococcales bacterium]|nr:hypothetical protein [Magnetococcales bacterium]